MTGKPFTGFTTKTNLPTGDQREVMATGKDIQDVFHQFNWVLTEEFLKEYHTNILVYQLVNALVQLNRKLNDRTNGAST